MKAENRVLLRPPSARDVRKFLTFVRENRRHHRPWVYPPDPPRGLPECLSGAATAAPFGRRGYRSEGLSHLVTHAFRIMKRHRIEANVQPGHDASIAPLKRAGFRKEGFSLRYLRVGGRRRDHERWAIIREDLDRRSRGRSRRTGR